MTLSLSFVDFLLSVKEFSIIFTWVDFCNKSFIPNCLSLSIFFFIVSLFFLFWFESNVYLWILSFFKTLLFSSWLFIALYFSLWLSSNACSFLLLCFLENIALFFVSGMLFTATNRFPCFSWWWIFLQLFAFFIN